MIAKVLGISQSAVSRVDQKEQEVSYHYHLTLFAFSVIP